MELSYRYRDTFGSYQMTYQNRILQATVLGAIGEELAKRWLQDLKNLLDHIDTSPWGYLGNLSMCEGYTAEAEFIVQAGNHWASTNGCVVDAYVIESALTKTQIDRSRRRVGITSSLSARLFSSEYQAQDFVRLFLMTLDGNRSTALS